MSFVQVRQRSGSNQSLPTERTPFYGARVPDEVKLMLKALKTAEPQSVKKILKFVVQSLEDTSIDSASFLSLSSDKLPEETCRVIFAGFQLLIKSALRQPTLKPEALKEDLSQLKLQPEIITDIGTVVVGKRRPRIQQSLADNRVRFPQMSSLKWRVDVTISNSSLNRVLEPTVLMEMTLSDGSIKTFEVSTSRFHELRYSVAFVLKEMEELEKRNILK